MSVKDIAEGVVRLCREGRHYEASTTYHASDVVSVEAMGPPGMDLVARGAAEIEAKSKLWADTHDVSNATVDGPFINGDQFAVHFTMDVTVKTSGQTTRVSEFALYTVKDDKVVEERFFYAV